ncbi:hypothetical protein [Massilia sp. S19_KUP03_FR1]|uniref:hypothetical protein n=1 Tax=Massilia sp. S19_KUP03_FR1 TaxID=3025503 RepID=UPI002FCD7FDD
MPLTAKLFAALLLVPASASAADALVYASAYTCDANAINQDLVDTCARHFPELTQDANDAIARWRSRNAAKASLAHDACEARIEAPESTPALDDATLSRAQLDGMRFDIRAAFQVRAKQEGSGACVEALGQLANDGSGLDFP